MNKGLFSSLIKSILSFVFGPSKPTLVLPEDHNEDNMENGNMSKKALCIGINNYRGVSNDLRGCVNDAQDWSNLL